MEATLKFTHLLRRIAPLAIVSLVVGCGGGSDGGPSLLSISQQNVDEVAENAVATIDFLSDATELVDTFADTIENEEQQVVLCEDGNVVFDMNDVAPQGELSSGDSMTVTFNACDMGGAVFNGSFSFVASDVQVGEASFSRTLDVEFDALTITSFGSGTIVVDGGFIVTLSTEDGITVVQTVSGSRLSVFAQGSAESVSGTMTNFSQRAEFNTETDAYSMEYTATFSGSGLAGEVTYETTVPFTGVDPEDPSAGTLVVTGANGSTLTLDVIDNVRVMLYLDVDGDGDSEWESERTWDELDDDSDGDGVDF